MGIQMYILGFLLAFTIQLTVRISQGVFSYLPDLSWDEIAAQIEYGLEKCWVPALEYSSFPHPRNYFWEMAGLPMFEMEGAEEILGYVEAVLELARSTNQYVRLCFYDNTRGTETCVCSFIIHRPTTELELALDRLEGPGRNISYTIKMDQGEGESEQERYS